MIFLVFLVVITVLVCLFWLRGRCPKLTGFISIAFSLIALIVLSKLKNGIYDDYDRFASHNFFGSYLPKDKESEMLQTVSLLEIILYGAFFGFLIIGSYFVYKGYFRRTVVEESADVHEIKQKID